MNISRRLLTSLAIRNSTTAVRALRLLPGQVQAGWQPPLTSPPNLTPSAIPGMPSPAHRLQHDVGRRRGGHHRSRQIGYGERHSRHLSPPPHTHTHAHTRTHTRASEQLKMTAQLEHTPDDEGVIPFVEVCNCSLSICVQARTIVLTRQACAQVFYMACRTHQTVPITFVFDELAVVSTPT